jgi:hypothetical protein
MAGDWIKMRTNLRRHPKVVRMASALNADRLRVVGGLHAVWSVFDEHSEDGTLVGYTSDSMDDEIGCPGFCAAMIAVGWLDDTGESLQIPRADAHNGVSAKRRAQETERKREARSVPKVSAPDADKLRSREEKRREELKDTNDTRAQAEVCRAAIDAGITGVNPSHPNLLAALAEGVTADEIAATAAELVATGKHQFAYLLATVRNRRAETKPVNLNSGPHHANRTSGRKLSAVEQVQHAIDERKRRESAEDERVVAG